MERKKTTGISGSRRKMLKKVGVASAFAVPTLMTYKISELQAQSSTAFKRANDNANFKRD